MAVHVPSLEQTQLLPLVTVSKMGLLFLCGLFAAREFYAGEGQANEVVLQ